jgi:phage terminase large subunit-like protein
MMQPLRNQQTPLTNSLQSEQLGSTLPRLWTPALRELTPETSYGFDLIDFARDVCGMPFDPWQEWLAIHIGELLPDGRPRFRYALVLVARQNGKTLFAKILTLYWMFVEQVPLILGTSTDRSYAKRTWQQVMDLAVSNPYLRSLLAEKEEKYVVKTTGDETFKTLGGSEYTFKANNRSAGRSMTLHRWICDELREHHNRDAWDAATNAMNAVDGAQAIAITNQGDEQSVVLDSLRTPALQFIETHEGDVRLGLFEWSAPAGSELDDVDALAAANPNMGRLGHGPDADVLIAAARRAKNAGGTELSGFKTEVLCMRVDLLDPAIEPEWWAAAQVPPTAALDLADYRQYVAMVLDVSLSGDHASLIAAAVIDGKVHVDVVAAWSGFGCTKTVRIELPALVEKARPRAVGWFPNGPAAAIAADMVTGGWQSRRVLLEAITTDTTAACMGLAELVKTGEIVHSGDPMLNAHIANAQKLRRGDAWVFTRRGTGPVDGAYALAGAVHLARTLPPPPPALVAL